MSKIRSMFTKAGSVNPDLVAYVILGIILVMYTWIEATHFTSAYQEVDPDGYLILAKRIAEGGPIAVKDDDPFMYQSHVWVENKSGGIAPKFAPGYPLMMSIAYLLGGDTAMFLISPIMGGLAILGAYFLFRLWMSRLAAVAGAFCLAINGMVLTYSGYLLTHAANICFAVWGMFFLWRWVRGIGRFSGLGAGFLLGAAVAMRHTSILLGTVLFAALAARWVKYLRDRRTVAMPRMDTIFLLASYAFPLLLLMIYDWVIFDSPLTTGYMLSGEQTAFTWGNISKNMSTLLSGLNTAALFILFPIGLAGLLLIGPASEAVMRFLWLAPLGLLYSSYYWAPSGTAYYRFLIVTFPAIVGSAFALMDSAVSLWRRKAIVFALFLAFLVFTTHDSAKSLIDRTVADKSSRSVALSSRKLSKMLDDNAVIFSQPPFFCYLGTRQHFRLYDTRIFASSYGKSAFKEGVTPRRQPLRNTRFREFYAGLTDSDLLEKKKGLIRDFLSDERQTVYFLPKEAVKAEQDRLGSEFQWEFIEEWDITPKEFMEPAKPSVWALYKIKLQEVQET